MRKRTYYKKKERVPDHKYDRIDVGLFINYLMWDGKRTVAEHVFYGALDEIQKRTKDDGVETFEHAIENVTPLLELVSRRVGGANYQIPRDVRPERKFFLASRWIITAARKKKGKPMHERLADELIAASKNEGEAIKKKQDTHRMAEANRAFASLLRR